MGKTTNGVGADCESLDEIQQFGGRQIYARILGYFLCLSKGPEVHVLPVKS